MRALKSGMTAQVIRMALKRKRDFPSLCLSIQSVTKSGKRVTLEYDIPCMTTTSPELLVEPKVPPLNVFLILPPLLILKPIIERMSRLSNFGLIRASVQGTMVFSVSGVAVKVETKFTNLIIPEVDPEERSGLAAPDETIQIGFDLRNFAKFLNCHFLSISHIVCGIVENHGMVFYVYLGEEPNSPSINYYIPKRED